MKYLPLYIEIERKSDPSQYTRVFSDLSCDSASASSETAPSLPSRQTPTYESSAPQLPSRAARGSVAIPNNDAPTLPLRTIDTGGAASNNGYDESPPVPSRANRMSISYNSVQSSTLDSNNAAPPPLPNRMSIVVNANPPSSAVKQSEGVRLPGLGSDSQPPRLPQRASVMISNSESEHQSYRAPQRTSVVPNTNGTAPGLPPRASVNYTQTLPNSSTHGNAGTAPPKQPPKSAKQAAPNRAAPMSAGSSKSLGDIPEIPAEERSKYSLIFKREDPNNTGLIEGPAAYALFNRSNLTQDDLAQIWYLFFFISNICIINLKLIAVQ